MSAADPHAGRIIHPLAILGVVALATSALGFLYLRARFDPAINQGDSDSLRGFVDMVARRQYDVSPLWPRKAPAWAQFGNLGQYADWQIALSLEPTVVPSIGRTLFTVLFLGLGYAGALEHWRIDRRTWAAVAVLLAGGTLGVLVYLNLHAGPSIGYQILPVNLAREARERDYFYVFGFWAWGIWAGIGATVAATRFARPAWVGALVACLPIILNWRAVTRRGEPEQSLPRVFAEAVLESAPRNATLFVMGDNDSYPLWYAQRVRAVRPDVAVITVPLLPTNWYRKQIARRFDLLDSAGTARYDGRMETAARIAAGSRSQQRPVAAAMTVNPAERERLGAGARWVVRGMVYVEGAGPKAESRDAVPSGAEPRAAYIDTVSSMRIAELVEARLPRRDVRPAIDPVHQYFRRMLDCPRRLVDFARDRDSTRLDSVCNYR